MRARTKAHRTWKKAYDQARDTMSVSDAVKAANDALHAALRIRVGVDSRGYATVHTPSEVYFVAMRPAEFATSEYITALEELLADLKVSDYWR